MAQKVTLVFPNIRALWEFAQATQIRSMEINTATHTLSCECNGTDLEFAREKYHAVVMERVSN